MEYLLPYNYNGCIKYSYLKLQLITKDLYYFSFEII